MATFDISSLLRPGPAGIERPWDALQSVMNAEGAGLPPYDILRTGDDQFRITLAVPGFTRDELTIETREHVVWVKAARKVDPNHNQYLYRGIREQDFQRAFQLPEHVRVDRARLEHGMLHIELVRELPEELRLRQIEIEHRPSGRPVLENTSQAA